MSLEKTTLGHCLCGNIRFKFSGEPDLTYHCHCESCRRTTSSPMTTWIFVPLTAFNFVDGKPRQYESSPGVRRGFCGDCGSPLTYQNEAHPDEIHLYAASLANPTDVHPSRHIFVAEQLDWFEVHDDLPRFETTSRGNARPIYHGPKK